MTDFIALPNSEVPFVEFVDALSRHKVDLVDPATGRRVSATLSRLWYLFLASLQVMGGELPDAADTVATLDTGAADAGTETAYSRGDHKHFVRLNRISNPALTTPSSLANGDLWVEASGVSPARTVVLYLRDGGASVPLLTVVY